MLQKMLQRCLALALCLVSVNVALAKDELGGIDTVTLYGVELPLVAPKADTQAMENFQKKNEKLFELKSKVAECFLELSEAAGEENEGRRAKKITKALEKLLKAERNFYKEAKKIKDKFDKNFKPLKQKKERLEEEIAKAEERGDDRTATKKAQEIQKFGSKYENLEKTMQTILSVFYIEENSKLLEYAEMAGVAPERVLPPELLEALQTMADAGKKGAKAEAKKAKEKVKEKDKDDDDDDDKPRKKARKKRKAKDED